MQIIIDDEYYIDGDPLNYVLVKKSIGINKKTGKEMNSERHISYHPKIYGALLKYVDIKQHELTEDFGGDINAYVDKLYEINQNLFEKIKNIKVVKDEDNKPRRFEGFSV